jgi:transposase
MTQNHSEFLDLDIVGVCRDGRRRYDPQAKRRLVEACLQPGVSLASLALRHGVNANLLRKWVRKHQEKYSSGAATDVIESVPSAFAPVIEIGRVDTQPVQQPRLPPPRPPAPSRLTIEMPNGVTLRLECGAQDATLVSTMIETLGRYDVPAGR